MNEPEKREAPSAATGGARGTETGTRGPFPAAIVAKSCTAVNLGEAAERHARLRGWYLFPCQPGGKAPATPHGHKDATNAPETIRRWWQGNPQANIGLACGASGLVVIDLDVPDGLEAWERLGIPADGALEQITPSGGRHLIWADTSGGAIRNSSGKLGPGIDVRANGGYIVLAPSRTESGGYCAVGDWTRPPAPLPEKLRDLLLRTEDQNPSYTYWLEHALERATVGTRNETGFWLACQLRDAGASLEEAKAILAQYAGRVPQGGEPYTLREALASAESAYTRPARAPAHGERKELPPSTALGSAELLRALFGERKEPPPGRYFPLTDLGNAELLGALYGERLRYDHRRGRWLIWNGHYWALDEEGVVWRYGVAAVRSRLRTAANIENEKERRAEVAWALSSEQRARLWAMLELAANLEPMASDGKGFDADPWLLGCANGVVDLRTGELRDGRPEDMITRCTGVHYDPQAKAERWERFLEEVFAGDKALIAFIQRAAGYSLTGSIREQCLFLCWGAGWNGKTTFLNLLRAMAGDYGANAAFSTFEAGQYGQIPCDLAALAGARLVTASETAEARHLNEARVKAVTGGDPVTARFLHHEWFSYRPQFKLWLALNYKPTITGTDDGIWRRIRLIPFVVSFRGRADKELEAKLRAELPGILAWAVRGCLEWQRLGELGMPEAVAVATEQYREESDILGQFLADCTEPAEGARVPVGDLYRCYTAWCEEQGHKPMAANILSRRLGERGIQRTRDKRERAFKGLKLV